PGFTCSDPRPGRNRPCGPGPGQARWAALPPRGGRVGPTTPGGLTLRRGVASPPEALRRTGPVLVLAALLCGAAACPAPARAQSPGAPAPADIERARRTFAEGEEAEARGDCATAIARYEAVVAIKETA